MAPIDIIHDPVKYHKIQINCYFSTKKHFDYSTSFREGKKIRYGRAQQCHYSSNYYGWKDKYDRHIKNSSGIPGIIYNF